MLVSNSKPLNTGPAIAHTSLCSMNVALISLHNYEKIVLLKKEQKKIEEVMMERIPVGRELRQEGGDIGVE